ELEDVAVELIGTGLRDHVDAAPGRTPDLRGEDTLGSLELLDELLANEIQARLSTEITDRRTIRIGRVCCVDVDTRALVRQAVERDSALDLSAHHNPGLQRDQLYDIAAVQGKVRHLIGADDLPTLGR